MSTETSDRLLDHQLKVQRISQMVREFAENAKPGNYFSIKKAMVSHMVPQADNPRRDDQKIDITTLTEILEIDPEKKICIAESGVPFLKLVRETMKYNLVPKCVSELKTITIGGAVAGCSVESMSFKYGGFYDSCFELEIISGRGDVLTCSREKHPEIFEMIHGSFGTLGILTLLSFDLVPAKPFVQMDYIKYPSFHELMVAIQEHYEKKDVEMMDAIVHSPKEAVLCIATFKEEVPYTHSYYWNIFYQSTLPQKRHKIDYLTTEDYFFRYDRECHWCTRNLGLENKALRTLLGPFVLGSSNILSLADNFPQFVKRNDPPDVVVDVFIPASNTEEFYRWYLGAFNSYHPLWIVPYFIDAKHRYPWINPDLLKDIKESLFIDCAIYAFPQKPGINHYKLLEDKVLELKGIKTLISHNFYTEKDFWASFNRPLYEKVKKQVDPQNLFRELYVKTHFKKPS